MRPFNRYASLTVIIAMLATVPGSAQKTTGPKAHYEMDVETTSGIGAMSMDVGSIIFGGGPKMDGTAYRLDLRLGSTMAPPKGAEKADHFVPPAMKVGKSIPLLGDEKAPTTPNVERGADKEQMERAGQPRGRLLLYWGCGAKAGKGQPVILDFSKLAKGQVPPNLWTTRVPVEKRLTSTDFPYYAYWPRGGKDKQPKEPSSLLGAHRIAGNFNPEINFNLAQDYMGGLGAKDAAQADGSVLLSWNNLAPATGYVAWAMGGKDTPGQESTGDMVWWTSSSAREFGGGLWDWLPPATVAKLVQQKIIMPPGQTTCQIPAEVKAAASGFLFGNLTAFGPEAHFSYPPKPADAKAVWNIDWTARVRYRSTAMLMIGMGDMMGGAERGVSEKPKEKTCKGPFGIKIPC